MYCVGVIIIYSFSQDRLTAETDNCKSSETYTVNVYLHSSSVDVLCNQSSTSGIHLPSPWILPRSPGKQEQRMGKRPLDGI